MTITQTVQKQLFGNDKVIRLALDINTRKNPSNSTQSGISQQIENNTYSYQDKQPFGSGKAWTHDEHARFLEALDLYPSGPWKIIAAYVGSKTTRQTMTHAQKYRQKIERRRRGLRTRSSSPLKKHTSEEKEAIKLSEGDVLSVPQLASDGKSIIFDSEHAPGSPSSVDISFSGAYNTYPTNNLQVQAPCPQNTVNVTSIGSGACHPQNISIPTCTVSDLSECSSAIELDLFADLVGEWEPLTFNYYNSTLSCESQPPFTEVNDFEAELAMTDDLVDLMLTL